MPKLNYRVFGKTTKPTIYYLCGYGATIKLHSPHIYLLQIRGYRVVAFEYNKDILLSGEPKELVEVLQSIEVIVNKDRKTHKTAGVLGISLGSWLGLNLMTVCKIKRGLFLTGGVSAANMIWEMAPLKEIKNAYISNGYSKDDLKMYWQGYDYNSEGSRFKDLEFMVISSEQDEVFSIQEVLKNILGWKKINPNIYHKVFRNYRHTPVIIRSMLLPSGIRFLKKQF